jgi:protein-arginine kinase activator protein McsA
MSKYDNSEYRVPARQDQETIKRQAAHIAELKATLQRMVTQFEGAAETQDDLDTLAEAKRVLK